MEHPTFDELTEECPSVEQMHESVQPLNAGQRAALERAYQSKFHIIQGPPGMYICMLNTIIPILLVH